MHDLPCVSPLRGAFEKMPSGDFSWKIVRYITPHAVDTCTAAAVALATVSLLFMEDRE